MQESNQAETHDSKEAVEASALARASDAGRIIVIDVVVMAVVLIVMYFIRFKSGLIGFRPGSENYRDLDYIIFLPCAVALWALAIYVVKGYEAEAQAWGSAALTRLATGTVLALLLIGVGNEMAKHSIAEWWGISRLFLLLSMGVGLVALAAVRMMTGKK